MVKKNEMTYLWSDRKRRLGLPLSFTKYSMSEDRIFYQTGFLNTKLEEILLYRILDISVHISLWQRIFGVGTIILKASDKTMPELQLKNVKHPIQVKEVIHQQIEAMKLARKMRIGEIVDDSFRYDGESGETE